MSELFDLAVDLVRAQAAAMGVRDNPSRVAPPDDDGRPGFSERPMAEQLDAAARLCRRHHYQEALREALVESNGYDALLVFLLDSATTDAEVGLLARQLVLQYLDRVAERRGEALADFL